MSGLATGLRNDAPDTAMVMRQRWRLAELRCEDYAFILLSRYLNDMDSSNMSAQLTQGRNDVWANPLGMLVLSVRHLGLSGWKPAECFALDNDISTWQKLGVAGSQVRSNIHTHEHPFFFWKVTHLEVWCHEPAAYCRPIDILFS